MFWKKKKSEAKRPAAETGQHPAIEPLKAAIKTQEDQNPHIRAQITGKEIVSNLMVALKDDRGVRVETLLGALGSFAGFSTVYAMVKRLDDGSLAAQMPEVAIVEIANGQKFYFGDYLNRQLIEGKISVFSMAAGMAQQVGATAFPDLNELFKRTAASIGKANFGVPDLPPDHHVGDLPMNFIEYLYPKYIPVLARYDLPVDRYYLACAFAIQEVIEMSKGTLDPNLAVKIVMECAVPASKLDPKTAMG